MVIQQLSLRLKQSAVTFTCFKMKKQSTVKSFCYFILENPALFGWPHRVTDYYYYCIAVLYTVKDKLHHGQDVDNNGGMKDFQTVQSHVTLCNTELHSLWT